MLQGQRHGFGAGVCLEFAQNAADVELHGGEAQHERIGDLGVAQTFDHQCQHFMFAFGQIIADGRFLNRRFGFQQRLHGFRR